jgi:8-oxo-dGTP diphosphatase
MPTDMPPPPDKDSLAALTEAMHRFVQSKGWYAPGSRRPQTPRNLAISLSLEANEVLEHFQWRDDLSPEAKAELAGELADVALYLLQLASLTEIDLGAAVMAKLEVNAGRTWDAN